MTIKITTILAVASIGTLVMALPATALTYPQVQTNSATNVQYNSALLSGYLYDLGGDYSVTVWFQYGTSTSYGYETNRTTQGYTGYFTQNVYNLYQNTMYHYRAVVQNGYSTSYGQDMTFSTGGGGGSNYNFYVQTNSANNISSNQVSLSGYVYGGSYTTLVYFQYGASTNYGYASAGQQVNYSGSTSQTISNLMPGTLYHYRAVAQNNNGQTVYGQDMTFTTGGSTGGYWSYPPYQPSSSYQAGVLDSIRQMLVTIQQILRNLGYNTY